MFLSSITLLGIHKGWAWVVIFSNGMAGIWILSALRLESLRSRAMWWFCTGAQISVFVQVALGLGLVVGERVNPPAFHPFYGFFAIVVIGMFYAYRQRMQPWVYWLYGIGGIFIMGLGVRAVLTAHAS